MPITDSFDASSDEIIKASDLLAVRPGFPSTALLTFDATTFALMKDECQMEPIARLAGAADGIGVYALESGGVRYAACVSPVGAPVAVAVVEELIAVGVRTFVVFGSCGVLDAAIDAGHIIVPTAAWRDEGTSYHYAPAADWIDVATSARTQDILRAAGVGVVAGKVWTTDAFYRETRATVERRRAAGCVAVEMECSALAAVAAWRGVDVYQFLYAADSLAADAWDARILGALPTEPRLAHVKLALEIARQVN